jgi:putative integral membrane protein (TIGR02587 family)
MTSVTAGTATPLRDEIRRLVRGLCGGFIFSLPIIYTMEMWQLGHTTPLGKILGFFAFAYVVAVGLNYVSGFREGHDIRDALEDAVEAKAIGLVVAAVMLVLMGVAGGESSWSVFLRQAVILAIPISIGASLARSQFGERDGPGDGQTDGQADGQANGQADGADHPPKTSQSWRADAKDVGLTIFGGIFLGFSVAPTEEILLIATQGHIWNSIGTMALALGISYLTLFEARFVGQSQRLASEGFFQDPWPETVLAYAVSLLVSGLLLWFLGFIGPAMALDETLAMVIALAFPVSLGGAAARLIL